MKYKYILILICSFIPSFLINYFHHSGVITSLTNSLTLTLSVFLFQTHLTQKNFLFNSFVIASFVLIPLFSYLPNMQFIMFLPLLSLSFVVLYRHQPKRWVLIIFALFLLIANLYSGEIIKYPFDIQNSQLIFNSPEINYNIERHQKDALFIPFKIRQIFYSQLVYIYAGLTNFFDFINLKNLSDIILIANLYPLFTGFYLVLKQENLFKSLCLIAFLVTMITSGIDRSPDKFQSLHLLGPILIYIIMLGLQRINRKAYFALWILTIFLLINPKI